MSNGKKSGGNSNFGWQRKIIAVNARASKNGALFCCANISEY